MAGIDEHDRSRASGSATAAVEVLFRPARPPDDPRARYPGFRPEEERFDAGTVVRPGGRPLSCAIRVFRDVAVPLRDGRTIYVDLFEPDGAARRRP